MTVFALLLYIGEMLISIFAHLLYTEEVLRIFEMTLLDELGWERHNQVFDYPQRFQFIGNSGINNEFESKIDGSYTPLDYFKIFVDSIILDLVFKQTNFYSKEYGFSNIDDPYYDVNEDEIMFYISLKMLMSILRKTE